MNRKEKIDSNTKISEQNFYRVRDKKKIRGKSEFYSDFH